MNYSFEIQKLLIQCKEEGHTDTRLNYLKQAIQLADTHADLDWGFELRISLIREESNTSRCIDSFPALSWLLDTYDQYPEQFDQSDFMYEYSWMLSSVRYNSAITMDQILLIFDDFKKRLLDCGFTLRPYYTAKALLFSMAGRLDEALDLLILRDNSPVDHFPVYPNYDIYSSFAIHLRMQNYDTAFQIAYPLLNSDTNNFMTFVACCTAVFYLTLNSQMDQAKTYYQKAVSMDLSSKNHGSKLTDIADLIFYLSKEDPEQGWSLFESIVNANVDTEEYLDFLFSVRVLPLLSNKGTRKLMLSSELSWYQASGVYNIDQVFDHYYKKAKRLADQFDARNGTTFLNWQLSLICDNHLKNFIK